MNIQIDHVTACHTLAHPSIPMSHARSHLCVTSTISCSSQHMITKKKITEVI